MNIDAFELQQILNRVAIRNGRAVLGSTGSTRDSYNSRGDSTRTTTTNAPEETVSSGLPPTGDAAIITYLKSYVSQGFNTINTLSSKMGSTAKWVLDNNQTSHPLWKYAAVNKAKGQSAADAVLKSDITKWASQLFGGSSVSSSGVAAPVAMVSTQPRTHEVIAYMKTYSSQADYNTPEQLIRKMQAMYDEARIRPSHMLHHYAKSGRYDFDSAIAAFITNTSSELFLASPSTSNLTITPVTPTTTVVPLQTSAKQAGFGDDLFNNKPLMYGVGAVAAAGLAYVLLK